MISGKKIQEEHDKRTIPTCCHWEVSKMFASVVANLPDIMDDQEVALLKAALSKDLKLKPLQRKRKKR